MTCIQKISYGSEIGSKLLYSKEEDVLQDLTLSIQTIGSKNCLLLSFYESSKTAIEQLKKKVGFELAFVGGNRKVSRKTDKYQIPRYISFIKKYIFAIIYQHGFKLRFSEDFIPLTNRIDSTAT